jgi:hypothetical protein
MTLRDYRIKAGLDYAQVAAYVAAQTERHYQPGTVALWEHRGIEKADVLVSLASLYGASMGEIIAAAKLSRQGQGPLQKRGPKPKELLQIA